MTYITKKDYIKWVANWKAEYKELAQEQRDLKIELKKAQRARKWQEESNIMYNRWQNKQKATSMLKERRNMKHVANASYLKDREEVLELA